MSLTRLEVSRFRNLTDVCLELSHGLNLFCGPNGSGKTSLLESCYFLASARSFRSPDLDPVIQRGEHECLARGLVAFNRQSYRLGVRRDRSGAREIRINNEDVRRASDLARLLPVLVLGPDTIDLLLGPPALRRRFLNWGLFHVKQDHFTERWEEANRCLRQRNRALRREVIDDGELAAWSARLAAMAARIDTLRRDYVDRFRPVFAALVEDLTGLGRIELHYDRGWEETQDLRDIYRRETSMDRKRGFTRKGFQRADVKISIAGQPAASICSRGELKALAWAMVLAQGAVAGDRERQAPLYLVDDLASEFDAQHRRRVCGFLAGTGRQVLLTAVDRQTLLTACEDRAGRLFHVKHGNIDT